MKAFFLAMVAMAVISVGADFALTEYAGFSSADQASGADVRLDD